MRINRTSSSAPRLVRASWRSDELRQVSGYQEARRAAVEIRLRGTQPHVRRMLSAARLPTL
jgi:hypothetical protein